MFNYIMSDMKQVPNDEMPEFGHSQYQGVTLEVKMDGRWEVFQPFYFDVMYDKEKKYYLQKLEDMEGYEIMGKVWISRNSDVILRATRDMLRVRQ